MSAGFTVGDDGWLYAAHIPWRYRVYYWLIKKLIGGMPVVCNAEIVGFKLPPGYDGPGIICNNRIHR